MNAPETVKTLRIALVGNPNCGKSALFNTLTGLRQKVANYPGATVERHSGRMTGAPYVELIDLPGTYSLTPKSPDEAVTCDALFGRSAFEARPDGIVCVLDATNLGQHLRFALELKATGLPMVVALNMTDLARREGIEIDVEGLSKRLGVPVIETVAVRKTGIAEIKAAIGVLGTVSEQAPTDLPPLRQLQRDARAMAREVTLAEGSGHKITRQLDALFLHPVAGPIILFSLLFVMFQAVFSWAETPMDMIDGGVASLQGWLADTLPDGWVLSLLNDGILAGVGSVVIFLPQILILFTFILALESSGYLVRAAYLMDRLMSSVGLNGRAFIPLLSSFACAIPGIMAARTIADPKDRLTTILIAPLMTCSARLPVYTLVIAAFIPNESVWGGMVGLQGLVMFGLYLSGIVFALLAAFVFKRVLSDGKRQPFLLELPKYQVPHLRYIFVGLLERAKVFLRRAGTIILTAMIILWVLGSYPLPPEGATEPDIAYSYVGIIGKGLATVFAPLGFNWEISVALVPGLAAREVAVAALGTVYALSGDEEVVADSLVGLLASGWTLPTALAFLAWYVFAPQCLSTIAVTKRETGGWKWPLVMIGYLFGLAYLAAFLTYRIALAFSA
ncbi:ferrous iron transporter B [Pseudokordiimonas caeni]|uniref:ferrous iron transporter B n=1 Tax=Pseudokordiimonas caeni TaxID=2997908 RepID=UPI002811F596|nr:ferrous iron transporter B [Pseudokordiimonas caeni]